MMIEKSVRINMKALANKLFLFLWDETILDLPTQSISK